MSKKLVPTEYQTSMPITETCVGTSLDHTVLYGTGESCLQLTYLSLHDHSDCKHGRWGVVILDHIVDVCGHVTTQIEGEGTV